MSTQKLSLENFEEIYNLTYHKTLKYIICKCSNIEDVNDLVQDTYIEFYNILRRKEYIFLDNTANFIIGIANKKVIRHYGLLYQLKTISIWNKTDDEEFEIDMPSDIDLEADVITKLNAELVWKYIKTKDMKIIKIFYLFYYLNLKISEIAKELSISESNVKNLLYRTIKDIKKNVKIEGDINV